jgi:hypothetical protein
MKIIKKSLGNRLFSFKGSERDDEFIIVMKRKQKLFLNSFSQNEIFSFNFRLKKYNTKENLKMTPDLIRLTTEESGENLTFEMPDQNISVIFDDCLLKSLLPSVGKLSPEFSPQTEDYIIHVPYSTKFIDFKTECSNDKKVKINRRKLNKAGSETEINVKVLGENSKKIYKIKIEREAKPKNFSKDFDKSPKPANEETPTEQHDQHGQHSEVNLSEGLILPAEAPELILKNNLFHEHLQDFFTVSSAIFIIFLIISRIKSKKRR